MGIPRFIILDPEGKIVTDDAERPSNSILPFQLDIIIMYNKKNHK